jgi:RNA polymerase-binding transcription factor DksA
LQAAGIGFASIRKAKTARYFLSGTGVYIMTPTELAGYRSQLQTLGRQMQDKIPALRDQALHGAGGEASGSLSNSPLHLADLGTDHYEQEMALSLLETQGSRIGEVAAALQRLDNGTFGRCERCQCDIPRARLDALPYTRYCVTCAEELQVGGVPAEAEQGL